MNVGNIYCIGRNYVKHAEELGNAVPEEPLLFSKPTHALVQADGREITLPQDKGEIHHELEIVLQMKREVKAGDRVADVVGAIALGVDLTLRDVQSGLKKKGHPWLRAKGFKQSAIVGSFWEFTSVEECEQVDFSFVKNGEVVQKGNISHMIFDFQTIIDECADCFGLGEGDLIYTGTPEGVGPLTSGDTCQLFWGEEEKGSFRVR